MEHWRGVMDEIFEKRKDAYNILAGIDKGEIIEIPTIIEIINDEGYVIETIKTTSYATPTKFYTHFMVPINVKVGETIRITYKSE